MAESAARLAELKIPAQNEFVGLAKRVATSLGSQLGFSLDKIDELGIAVAQACGSSIEAAEELWGSGATLKLSFATIENGIDVEVETIAPRPTQARPGRPSMALARNRAAQLELQRALVQEIIRLFVDDFRHQVDPGRRQIRYRMVKYLIS
jgi:anti-sigma regulatory factor (Ser/Thr protein kinase)